MQVQELEFMSRVVPWPADEKSAGYVDLIWTPGFSGKPTKTLTEFKNLLTWAQSKKDIKDLYYCLSLQAEAGKNGRGNLIAKRHASNAIALKAIWLDIDVKAAPKGYPTLAAAIDALGEFRKAAGLPAPSALVHSGGGLHAYWISDRGLSTVEWEPYAQGLKALALKHELRCDAGVTADAARILRIPGTANFKTDPPKPVRLLALQPMEKDYDFATALSALPPLAGTIPARSVGSVTQTLNLPRAGAFASLPKESLAEGLGFEDKPLAVLPIMKGCAFLRNALLTGGKDYDQPMWNLTTLCATFMENGHDLAHKMGSKHSDYTPESTDRLWDRKRKDREDKGLGYPSCNAIRTNGCKACETCPHFAAGKSPLNLRATAVAKAVDPTVPSDDMQLPDGHCLDDEGYICKVVKAKKDSEPDQELRLFYNKFSNPWVGASPKALNFTITTDKGRTEDVAIPLEDMSNSAKMWDRMYKAGVTPVVHLEAQGRGFMVAWLSKIQKEHEAQASVPFGWWHDEAGKRRGFVFGGEIFKDDGTVDAAGYGSSTMRRWYKPTGTREAWNKSMAMVLGEGRPELACIAASTFAAPLAFVPGEYSGMLSVWGESGCHKSAAVKCGLGAWGNPKLSKEVAQTTPKMIIKKMGDLRNLAIYHDEIKDEEAQKGVFTTLFAGSEGVEGGRLTSSVDYRERGDWQTMIVICSNRSFVDYVNKKQKTTDAGIYRVFEFQMLKTPDDAPGKLPTSMDATRITQEMEHNFGVVGLEYAQMLGRNPDEIDAFTQKILRDFSTEVDAKSPERYWVAVCATLLAGAELANRLGAGFDVPAMKAFLISRFMLNRERCAEANSLGGSVTNTEGTLAGFLKKHLAETLRTETYHHTRGKPKHILVIDGPNKNNPKPINVHWATKDRMLLVSSEAFNEYLTLVDMPPAAILRGLKIHYNMERKYICLGAGTHYGQLQESVLCMPVPEGSPLEQVMNIYAPTTSAA